MKKRLTAWIMILIMCLSLLPVSVLADLQDPTAGLSGSGTAVNPYLIETADQLYDLAMYVNNTAESYEDVWFVLANDIGTEEKPFPYMVIGATDETPFKGHFDGRGYTVTVQTDGSAPDLIVLFPNLGGVGVVENLNVRKVVFIPCYVTIEVESASRMLQFPKLDETGLLLTVQPDPEKEGFVFNGYLDEDGHRYFDGNTIPADAFTLENGAYRITLVAEFTQEEDPDVTYTDVDRYYPTVVVVSPDSTSVDEIDIEYNPSFTVSPYAVSLDQCVDVNFPDTFRQMRQYVMMGLSPVGYRSLITGNVFKRDDALAQPISIALNKLPTPKYIGRELEETSATTGNRISNYEITDYLVPLFSFDDGEGAFLDPLYELTIYYEVPDKITNSDDPDAGYFLAGTETISISMNDLVGDGLIELTGAPEYTGYIFEGYSSLADPEGILFEDNLVILDSDPDYGNVVYDGNGQYRLMVKLHYREDPNYTPDPMTLTENGTYGMKLGGRDAGKFTFEKNGNGWSIHNGEKYLAMQGGKLALSDTAFAWTYKSGAFSASTKTTQKTSGHWFGFIYIPGSNRTVTTTYYLSTVTDGGKLSTNSVKAELYVEASGEHEFGCWIDCKDGANHKRVCKNCGEVETEAHKFDPVSHKCVCGAYDPEESSVTISASVKEKTEKQYIGLFPFGYYKNVKTYTATIQTEAVGVCVTKVQYQLNGGRWTTGTSISSDKPIETLKVKAWDSNGKVYNYTYGN